MNNENLKKCFDTTSEYYLRMMKIVKNNQKFAKEKTTGRHLHHVIPRSFFRSNNIPIDNTSDNLVSLTPYEHCIIHFYIYKCCCQQLKRSAAYTVHLMYALAEKSLSDKYLDNFASMYNEATSFLGVKPNKETRRKMSAAKTGKRSNNAKLVYCTETDTVYDTALIAAKELGVSNSEISLVCNGKKPDANGYHFIYRKK